jgi:hypothetical protein
VPIGWDWLMKSSAKHGVKGLYSRSLYKYDEAFINRLGSAIEMGKVVYSYRLSAPACFIESIMARHRADSRKKPQVSHFIRIGEYFQGLQ